MYLTAIAINGIVYGLLISSLVSDGQSSYTQHVILLILCYTVACFGTYKIFMYIFGYVKRHFYVTAVFFILCVLPFERE